MDTNPSQDCEWCSFGLPVCADCVATDEWLRCSDCTPGDMKSVMDRRRVLKLAGRGIRAAGYWLTSGFVGGTSWRVIDSIRIRLGYARMPPSPGDIGLMPELYTTVGTLVSRQFLSREHRQLSVGVSRVQ